MTNGWGKHPGNIDFERIFKDMMNAASVQIKTEPPDIQRNIQQILRNHKNVLLALVGDTVQKKISIDDFKNLLADEQKLIEIELLNASIKLRVSQKATNAAINFLTRVLLAEQE